MRTLVLAFVLAFSLAAGAATNTLRVMTFNIHHGTGSDGKLDLERIAALIKTQKVDIVALQEVDRGTTRTGRRDLPAELARLTGMKFCFGKNIDYKGGGYGNAILSRFPVLEATNSLYQMLMRHEQRGLLQCLLDVDGRKLLFMSTHLDYHNDDAERVLDAKTIKAAIEAHTNAPAILCGDFNEGPGSRTYKRLGEFLADTWKAVGDGPGFTFSSSAPWSRIDYMWHSKELRPLSASVPKTDASDHLPIVGEFLLE